MAIQISTARTVPYQQQAESLESRANQAQRWLRIPRLTALVVGCLTLITAGTLVMTQAASTRPVLDPSLDLLDRPLPAAAYCNEKYGCFCGSNDYCYTVGPDLIYLLVDLSSRRVVHTIMSVRTYTIGDLIAAWGTPTGIRRNCQNVTVYWGTRSAYLYTYSFRPENRSLLIQNDLVPSRAEPWRGFVNAKGVGCSGS